MNKNEYKLTNHPLGSLREVWAMSWPLMLGLMSNSLMLFVDRMLLSWYDTAALNAITTAALAFYLFSVFPLSVCAISEVMVGRLHGEGRPQEIGRAVWQMIWFSLLLSIPYWLSSLFLPSLIFYQSGNEVNETAYFNMMVYFAPMMLVVISLCGFYIGIGRVRIIFPCVIAGNLLNVMVGYLLIFGWGVIPSLGITGAALATGISQSFQVLLLLSYFFSAEFRKKYRTTSFKFHAGYFVEALRLGTPSGIGRSIEVTAHFIFFRIVMLTGSANMTIAALVQSFYLLFSFLIESESKSVGAIVANLIGAGKATLSSLVFWSGIKLHSLFFCLLFGATALFPDSLIGLFFIGNKSALLMDPEWKTRASEAMILMSFYYLFEGFSWILIGQLVAAGDTKFIFYVSCVVNSIVYILPAYLLIAVDGNGANVAWMILAIYGMVKFIIYYRRYSSGNWLLELSRAQESDVWRDVNPEKIDYDSFK